MVGAGAPGGGDGGQSEQRGGRAADSASDRARHRGRGRGDGHARPRADRGAGARWPNRTSGIITNIHPVHLELLGTLENIAEAKAELIARAAAGRGGGGPARVRAPGALPGRRPAGRVVRFAARGGLLCANETADVLACAGARGGRRRRRPCGSAGPGVRRAWRSPRSRATPWRTSWPRRPACYAAGLPVARLPCPASSTPVRARAGARWCELPGLCVIDDTYNANPAAVRAALDNLVRLAARSGRPARGRARGHAGAGARGASLSTGRPGSMRRRPGCRLLWGVGPLSGSTAEGFRPQSKADALASGLRQDMWPLPQKHLRWRLRSARVTSCSSRPRGA